MNRLEAVEKLAAMCREHPYVALSIVAWLAAPMTLEALEQALEAAEEARAEWVPADSYLRLVEERYGRRGDRK
jgi:hypothetical protein